jgi:hypothetical protein
MIQPVPEEAFCATHRDTPAKWTCPRCGNFLCVACERRIRPDALPMCPACWELRAVKVPELKQSSPTRLQTAALVVGCISVLPIIQLQIGSLVLCIVALVKAKDGPARAVRWKPVVGLCCTLAGMMIWLAIIGIAILRH